jgi:hypothetical protein
VIRVGGKDAASLRAISEFNDRGVGGRKLSAGEKKASPSDLKDFKSTLKVQYTIQLNASNGAPRCEAHVRVAIGTSPWNRLCILYSAQDPPSVVKELHAQGKEAFVAETGRKALIWWNQKKSEAANIKEAWEQDKKKRSAAPSSEEPAPKRVTAPVGAAAAVANGDVALSV